MSLPKLLLVPSLLPLVTAPVAAQTPSREVADRVEHTFDPYGPFDDGHLGKDPVGGASPAPDIPIGNPTSSPQYASQGGPANDTCSTATVIPGNVVTYNPPLLVTTGAVTELCENGESCESGGAGVSNSVWYSYTPDADGSITVDTLGSNYNTVLSIHDACGYFDFGSFSCEFGNELACSDDYFFGTNSQVWLDVVAGETYLIKVSDYDSNPGGGLLDFDLSYAPANDACINATRVIGNAFDPPLLSTHNAVTGLCEAEESCESNGVGVSNAVWYSFVAPCDGALSVNTNGSTYDTVLSIHDGCGEFVGIDTPCDLPNEIACDDDSGTGLQSQLVDVPVQADLEYLIKVADYNTTQGGGYLDFNLLFTPGTAPVAELDVPTNFDCLCDSIAIEGTARVDGGALANWVLDYQSTSGGPWTEILSSDTAVNDGTLALWSTAGLSHGYYLVRLTVNNGCGFANTAMRVVFVDKAFDTFDLQAPAPGPLVLGGTVCIEGTIWDRCFDNYSLAYVGTAGSSGPIGAGTFTSTATNQALVPGGWNTLGIADGTYELEIVGTDQCGHTAGDAREVVVDNTPPVSLISSPSNCQYVDGQVTVRGSATDTNFDSWVLQYTGGSQNGWATIATGASPVFDGGVLATWNVPGEKCAYTLRLLVYDRAIVDCVHRRFTEYTVSVSNEGPVVKQKKTKLP